MSNTPPRRIASWLLAGGGMLLAANAVLAGPHAFGGGAKAVLVMVCAGLACLVVGVCGLLGKPKG